MFSFGLMVITICSFDAVIAVVYATVRRYFYSTSLIFSTAIISSSPAVFQIWYIMSAVEYVLNLDIISLRREVRRYVTCSYSSPWCWGL